VKKDPTLLIVAGLCAAGVVFGAGARLLTTGRTVSPATTTASENRFRPSLEKTESAVQDTGGRPAPTFSPPPHSPSKDDLETLAALDDEALYSRLALWLVDSSEQDIAAYWSGYLKKSNRSNDIIDLVFINWARLNPQGAIAATAGGKDEHYAWWAWAAYDPKSALAAAIAANPDRVNNVAWGIGEFHPDWLRKHFSELPESARGNAFSGLEKWGGAEDPLEMLKFRQENQLGFDGPTFTALVRKDPWSALDWVKENPRLDGIDEDEGMRLFLRQMATEHPDDLARLIKQSPSGNAKRQMETALFNNLLKTDPEAALEQAKASDVPRIAVERLAAVGLSVVKSDPEQAFGLVEDLFTACPSAMNFMEVVRYPNGSSASGDAIPGVDELTESLMVKDPTRLMDLASGLRTKDRERGNLLFDALSEQWAERDLSAYTGWVNLQTDPAIRDSGSAFVINQLRNEEHFPDAADWAMSLKSDRSDALRNTLGDWAHKAPDEAAAWLDNADLPADEKADLQNSIFPADAKDQ
jgi:hypothetical protein